MKSLCIFCGSNPGAKKVYKESAVQLGKTLAESGMTLVYGGSSVGIMGAVADAALEAGGDVIGVIPQSLVDREVAHPNLTKLHVVHSMHERKALMADLSEGFVALPGGIGTLEEFFEVLTWAQLGEHDKPCSLYNVDDYYAPLLDFFDHMIDQKFFREETRSMVLIENEPQSLLKALRQYRAPHVTKWIDDDET